MVVPTLYYLFGHLGVDEAVRMKMAVGTSLATIVATAWSSASTHWRQGNVDKAFLKSYGPFVLGGVLLGAALASALRGSVLTGLFAAVALPVAAQIAFGNPAWRLGDAPPRGLGRVAIGGTVGALSAMLGIGGGIFMVPTMTMYGHTVHRAVGTAAAMGFVIGVPGMLGFMAGGLDAPNLPPLSLGYVSLTGLALIAPASVLVAPLGARLAQRLDTAKLRRVFALFLALTALRMLWTIVG